MVDDALAPAVKRLNAQIDEIGNSYNGVKETSNFLKNEGVSRIRRKEILESFEIETISLKRADNNTFGLRFYGGDAQKVGRYLFPTFTNYTNRQGLALPIKWNNTMDGIQQFRLDINTPYIYGRAASQAGIYKGGSYQMYINNTNKMR